MRISPGRCGPRMTSQWLVRCRVRVRAGAVVGSREVPVFSAALGFFVYRYQIDDPIERYGSGSDFYFRNRGRATIDGIEPTKEPTPVAGPMMPTTIANACSA